MFDVVIEFFAEIGQVLLDLWIDKVVNRFRKKKKKQNQDCEKEEAESQRSCDMHGEG